MSAAEDVSGRVHDADGDELLSVGIGAAATRLRKFVLEHLHEFGRKRVAVRVDADGMIE